MKLVSTDWCVQNQTREAQIRTGGLGVTGETYATDTYSGELNTLLILTTEASLGSSGSSMDAKICYELVITEGDNTYSNWYIPSKEELNLMYENKATIDATAVANGGSAIPSSWAVYWSSTEESSTAAWAQAFSDLNPPFSKVAGEQFIWDKPGANMYLRPIRSF